MRIQERKSSRVAPSTRRKMKRQRREVWWIPTAFLCVSISFILYIQYQYSHPDQDHKVDDPNHGKHLRGGEIQTIHGHGHGEESGNDDNNDVWITHQSQFNHDSVASRSNVNHAIIVCGHSVIIGTDLKHAGTSDKVWFELEYQKDRGLPQAILSHIQRGIEEASKDPNSLLILSGGETRSSTGPLSEGQSYFTVADANHLWGETDVRARTVTEEYATDSFQNLLFSVCRFREVVGSYPDIITVISFSFKQERFVTLHAPAMRLKDFRYIGVDPPQSSGFSLQESMEGEKKNALSVFKSDPYGCYSKVLRKKREERNPFFRTSPYPLTCPDMKTLLEWCGPDIIPKKSVPW